MNFLGRPHAVVRHIDPSRKFFIHDLRPEYRFHGEGHLGAPFASPHHDDLSDAIYIDGRAVKGELVIFKVERTANQSVGSDRINTRLPDLSGVRCFIRSVIQRTAFLQESQAIS